MTIKGDTTHQIHNIHPLEFEKSNRPGLPLFCCFVPFLRVVRQPILSMMTALLENAGRCGCTAGYCRDIEVLRQKEYPYLKGV